MFSFCAFCCKYAYISCFYLYVFYSHYGSCLLRCVRTVSSCDNILCMFYVVQRLTEFCLFGECVGFCIIDFFSVRLFILVFCLVDTSSS